MARSCVCLSSQSSGHPYVGSKCLLICCLFLIEMLNSMRHMKNPSESSFSALFPVLSSLKKKHLFNCILAFSIFVCKYKGITHKLSEAYTNMQFLKQANKSMRNPPIWQPALQPWRTCMAQGKAVPGAVIRLWWAVCPVGQHRGSGSCCPGAAQSDWVALSCAHIPMLWVWWSALLQSAAWASYPKSP